MEITAVLITLLGKPIAERLVKALSTRKGGAQKLEEASIAMAHGLSAIEALKKVFGKDLLMALNEAMGTASASGFSYEAGTQSYVKISGGEGGPLQQLRDELNINLDRLSVLEDQRPSLVSQVRGVMTVWLGRCQHLLDTDHQDDIRSTAEAIQTLLRGDKQNYREVHQLLSATTLGGAGALMSIAGVLVATGTGGGVVSSVMWFLFGVPWLAAGALVIPGALLLVLAAKSTRPADDISLAIAVAYKLLDRCRAR